MFLVLRIVVKIAETYLSLKPPYPKINMPWFEGMVQIHKCLSYFPFQIPASS